MIRLHSFSDEFLKVAESLREHPKKKLKLSGEVTVDRDHFVDTLERAEQTPKRGPHPALNYEHSWSKQAHPALSLEHSIFKVAALTGINPSAKTKKKGINWTRALATAGTGIAAGAGAYGLARRIKFSKNPLLRDIQKKSKGRLSHLEALDYGQKPTSPIRKKFNETIRGVDEIIEEPAEKWVPRAEAADAAIQNTGNISQAAHKAMGKPTPVKGALHAMLEPSQQLGFKPDLSLGARTSDVLRSASGKLEEAKYFPGILPKTESIANYAHTGPIKSDAAAIDALQDRIKAKYPKGYIIKPDLGHASGGVPTHEQRWSGLLEKGDPEHAKWVRGAIRNPKDYIVQEHIPIAKERAMFAKAPKGAGKSGRSIRPFAEVPTEYRVHAFGGQVVPGGSQHRWAAGREFNPLKRKELKEMEAFVQANINKLPKDSKGIPMALDVVRTKNGGWQIIEANPGGRSGFLAPEISGTVGTSPHATYKAITGRSSQLASGAKGVAAGVATGVAANQGVERLQR